MSFIALLPYNILSNLNNNIILSDYAIGSRILQAPYALYTSVFFVKYRNSILRELNDGTLLNKFSKYHLINKSIIKLLITIPLISILLLLMKINPLVISLIIISTTYFIYQLINFELFAWKYSSLERIKILLPGLILSILILNISHLSISLSILLLVSNCFLQVYLIEKSLGLRNLFRKETE